MKPSRWIQVVLLVVLTVTQVSAHTLGQSYLYLKVHDNSVEGRVEARVEDLDKALDLGLGSGPVTEESLRPHLDVIEEYLEERLAFGVNRDPGPVEFDGFRLYSVKDLGQYLVMEFPAENTGKPETIEVDYRVLMDHDPNHVGMLVIEEHWKAGVFANESEVSLILNEGRTRQTLDLDAPDGMLRGFLAFVKLGAEHILEGIDHIFFLAALLLPAALRREDDQWVAVDSFKDALWYVLKVVTLFTVAHSVTLCLAALHIVELPSRLVESLIALSIAVAALDVMIPMIKEKIWIVVFVFGLFHGFGFAGILNDIGLQGNYLVLSLLGFNLGVELGQVAIIAVLFPLIYMLRNSHFYCRYGMQLGSVFLIVVALNWFIERSLGVNIRILATLTGG